MKENKEIKHERQESESSDAPEDDLDIGFMRNIFSKNDKKQKDRHAKKELKEQKESKDLKEHDESDDDMSLDISFAKKWFPKKHTESSSRQDHAHNDAHHEAHHGSHHYHAANAEHDEAEQYGRQQGDDEVSIDFSFIKKINHAKILTVLLILVPLILTICIRSLPSQLPVTDDWAQSTVYNYYRNQIAQSVSQTYPNLPDANRQKLVTAEFDKFLSANKAVVDQQTQYMSEQFKQQFRYEENGRQITYLGDLDSYFWLRYARNYVNKGMTCDAVIEGRCVDTHMLAPTNQADALNTLHIYAIIFIYKAVTVFKPSYTLMESAFQVPLILALIASVIAFLIGRKIAGNIGGFFASILVSVSPVFLSRSLGSDTDIWNITMPLLIFWLFLEAFESKSTIRIIIYSLLSGLAVGVFSLAWTGWWYVFDFMMGVLIAYCLFIMMHGMYRKGLSKELMGELRKLSQPFIIFAVMLVVVAIFITVASNFGDFFNAVMGPISFTQIKIASHSNLWPNVYTTVAELNEAGINVIVGQAGGAVLFFIALFGITTTLVNKKPDWKEWLFLAGSALVFLYLMNDAAFSLPLFTYLAILALPLVIGIILIFLKKSETDIDIKIPILLMIWFLGTIYASTKGVRFVLLMIPAFAIAFSAAIHFLYELLSEYSKKHDLLLTVLFSLIAITFFWLVFKVGFLLYAIYAGVLLLLALSVYLFEPSNKHRISRLMIFGALAFLLVVPTIQGHNTTRSFLPSINDAWWDSLTYIKDNSSPDAIINSWWDFGHWFKYVADRRVTADGATQNTPQAHWLGLLLQTPDEERSIAVLRMLDCGGNHAFDEIDKRLNDTERSENLVSEIIMMSKEDAGKELASRGFTQQEADKILDLTHCVPPEDYLITSEDMVGKAGVWAHFGLWDFDRAWIVVNAKGKPTAEAVALIKNRFGYTESQALNIFNEVESLSDEQSVNNWIGPWPNYISGMAGCTNVSATMISCAYGVDIGGSGNQRALIDKAVINLSDKTATKLIVGIYDTSTNFKIGENVMAPAGLVYADKKLQRTAIENSTFDYDVLLVKNTDGSYTSLMSSPMLSQSVFTQLFFLDGKYNSHFEKFVEKTSPTGTHVIVWKVDWAGAQNKKDAADAADTVGNNTLQLNIV